MCTALYRKEKHVYFGRNLDLDFKINESIIITPRNYEIKYKFLKENKHHNAICGIGQIVNNYPLYYDAINEYGLSYAGLNFPNNAYYFNKKNRKKNIAPFELVLYLLGNFKTIKEVKKILTNINIVNVSFNEEIKNSPLHFMMSDLNECIVIEQTNTGLNVYDNPYNVLTNSPEYPLQIKNLNKYSYLTNEFKDYLSKPFFSNGLSLVGMPGDYSSMSRFVKAHHINKYTPNVKEVKTSILNYFNIMNSVSMPLGAVITPNGYEITRYTSCYNLNDLKLYYRSNKSPNIFSLDMLQYDLNKNELISEEFNYEFRLNH